MVKERHYRSVTKAVSWRVCATLTTITVVYVFTRELVLALEIGVVEVTAKLLFYYLHERIWGKISWGKSRHPLEDIQVKKELTPEDKKKVEDQLKDLGYM